MIDAGSSTCSASFVLDTLSIDTGSANVFIGGKLDYVKTNLSTNTTQPVVSLFLLLISLLEIFTPSGRVLQRLWFQW